MDKGHEDKRQRGIDNKAMRKKRRWYPVIDRVSGECRGAEVGVYYGRMSRRLLEHMPGLTLYMVDCWKEYSDDQKSGSARLSKINQEKWDAIKNTAYGIVDDYKDRAIILEGDSVAMADEVEDASLDFVFIDGDHSYRGVKRDIRAWKPKVKPGGWLMGHDANRPGVLKAVQNLGLPIETDVDRVWAVRL